MDVTIKKRGYKLMRANWSTYKLGGARGREHGDIGGTDCTQVEKKGGGLGGGNYPCELWGDTIARGGKSIKTQKISKASFMAKLVRGVRVTEEGLGDGARAQKPQKGSEGTEKK